ncbi:MAG: GNAT family N-acetyltransferase [Clostridium sp.]|nr:GNAT family N-acetyltransferase [Clostridium sp.]
MDMSIDITKVIIETDRLILRSWKETDLNDFYEYASVEGVGEMAGWKHHESIEVSKKILQSFIAEKNVFAIVYKENNKVIGSLGLHVSDVNDEASYKDIKVKEIGYVLSKAYWGMGLMPEAVKAVIKYCFDKCHLNALTIRHFSTNIQSKRVIEKCGFKFVKKKQNYVDQLESYVEDVEYVLLNYKNVDN